MLTKPMKTLIRKELREHYATAAWTVILGAAALLLAAIYIAVTVMIGEDPASSTPPTLLRLVRYPSCTAATIAGLVGVIACSGAFAADGAPVTGVFVATRPLHRRSIIAAKFVSIGALVGAAFIILLIVGAVTEAALRLPPPGILESAEWTFSAARDLPKMLVSGVGVFLAANGAVRWWPVQSGFWSGALWLPGRVHKVADPRSCRREIQGHWCLGTRDGRLRHCVGARAGIDLPRGGVCGPRTGALAGTQHKA